ncbi:hypothetical protein [Amycolatopsis sp. PS_44_ISF1]|uniref:hypothetical protein n=1 Tax=Amycolatopsis sp. PS_44_ISF1 TaxID=2974917 RepID=UPI0028DDF80F|nr:hypothetical protein [Amycolatopsis sp. PS_44_ISF1]MDT8915811.1 hypothetical protein [Amycolatopsis sp. PS_44_ISF1]
MTAKLYGTGPTWAAPAAEAQRITDERAAKGVDTLADHLLARVFAAMAADEPHALRAALVAVEKHVSTWINDLGRSPQ